VGSGPSSRRQRFARPLLSLYQSPDEHGLLEQTLDRLGEVLELALQHVDTRLQLTGR
jgi:hypothetical protein